MPQLSCTPRLRSLFADAVAASSSSSSSSSSTTPNVNSNKKNKKSKHDVSTPAEKSSSSATATGVDLFRQYAQAADGDPVDFSAVQQACSLLHRSVWESCRGSGLHLVAPPARVRSPELEARCAKFRAALEQKEYSRMVSDIDRDRVREESKERLTSYNASIVTGMQFIFTIFTATMIGLYVGKFMYPHDPAMATACCAAGAILGVIVEGSLFVIKLYREDEGPRKLLPSERLRKMKRAERDRTAAAARAKKQE